MKAIQLHIEGIKTTFETLSKGKFLTYFIPGAVIGLIALYFYIQASAVADTLSGVEEIPFVGGIVSSVFDGIGSLIAFMANEFYKFVLLVCLSPVNCILSEKFDNHLTGNKFEGGIIRILNDIIRAIIIVIIALILEYTFLGLWWFISFFVPFDEIITPIIQFVITSFFVGFAFYDYSLERYGKGTFASLGFAFSKISTLFLTGSIFTLIYYIPVIGIIVAPVLVTMIATVVYIRMQKAPLNTNKELLEE
jgi:CysZ protein